MKAHPRAGLFRILTGAAYGVVALYDREIVGVEWLASWFTNRWIALCWSIVFTLIGGIVATLIWGEYRPEEKEALSILAEAGWLERSREALPPPKEHPFARGIPAFLQPGLLAVILIVDTAVSLFVWFW